jgi:hypothetical protein
MGMATAKSLSDFARKMLGESFCLNCYKDALGLQDMKEAQAARSHLLAEGVYVLDQGKCEGKMKRCAWQGTVITLKKA